jgi:cadmium resistance protein CadD (predicted permease)
MDHIAVSIGIGVVAFASTNIDDLVLLIGFFADPGYRPRHILGGQFAGIAALVALSLLGAMAAQLVPPAEAGLLGLVPIAIGIKKLAFPDDRRPAGSRLARGGSRSAAVALVTIANGGDNLSLYIPLFAAHDASDIALFIAIFLAMTALWCAAGYALVNARPFGVPAERWGAAALPYVLIALGVYILAKTGVVVWPA